MIPASNVGRGTRSPSVPPVTQKNFNARLYSACDNAKVRIPKKIRVWRTQI
jgi:hypothetical protein